MVTVNLKNKVYVEKQKFAGDYQISETVNGKPSWKSGENAIWYVGNNWLIGCLKKLGKKLICAAIAQSTVHNSTVSSWALDPIFVVTFLNCVDISFGPLFVFSNYNYNSTN